jgi:hypothetical protein
MKSSLKMLSIAFIAVLLQAGCSEEPAKVEAVPVTSIEQQNREIAERLAAQKSANEAKANDEGQIAERLRFVNLVLEPVTRWRAAFDKLEGKKPSEMTALVAEMQSIRSELASVSTSSCTEPKLGTVLTSMDQVATLLSEFKSANGEVKADFSSRLGEAASRVVNASSAVGECR